MRVGTVRAQRTHAGAGRGGGGDGGGDMHSMHGTDTVTQTHTTSVPATIRQTNPGPRAPAFPACLPQHCPRGTLACAGTWMKLSWLERMCRPRLRWLTLIALAHDWLYTPWYQSTTKHSDGDSLVRLGGENLHEYIQYVGENMHRSSHTCAHIHAQVRTPHTGKHGSWKPNALTYHLINTSKHSQRHEGTGAGTHSVVRSQPPWNVTPPLELSTSCRVWGSVLGTQRSAWTQMGVLQS
jgi:hypothetical protein